MLLLLSAERRHGPHQRGLFFICSIALLTVLSGVGDLVVAERGSAQGVMACVIAQRVIGVGVTTWTCVMVFERVQRHLLSTSRRLV